MPERWGGVDRTTRILGVDPGSRKTGFALARFDRGGRLLDLELGTWSVRAGVGRAAGLSRLHAQAAAWLAEHRPDVAAVEGLFHHRNSRAALALAEARGAVLAALGAAEVPVVEYSPATVKKTVCGHGGAAKEQVVLAIERTVPGLDARRLAGEGLDATDALAIAVCHQAHARLGALARETRR